MLWFIVIGDGLNCMNIMKRHLQFIVGTGIDVVIGAVYSVRSANCDVVWYIDFIIRIICENEV